MKEVEIDWEKISAKIEVEFQKENDGGKKK